MTELSDILAQHLACVPVHRALIRALEHRLFADEVLQSPVLDIGCGDGHYARAVFPDGLDVGIDITHEIVAEGRRNGPYHHVDVADGTRLPFADASFRTVVSNCVIEHIPDIEASIREIARVLMPGGKFVFSVPNDRFTDMLFTVRLLRWLRLGRLAVLFGNWWNRNAAHYHLDTPITWRARLATYGLAVERQAFYMSGRATCVFELSHYYAIPSMIWHRFTGRWSLQPARVQSSFAYFWLKPYAEEAWPAVGSCTFFAAHK